MPRETTVMKVVDLQGVYKVEVKDLIPPVIKHGWLEILKMVYNL